ncbi:MAG TPA: hypothetical protein VK932_19530 [Kofleriaceae bacterium]|nr:hypothetical protein [Kofleriaceae bacterium]
MPRRLALAASLAATAAAAGGAGAACRPAGSGAHAGEARPAPPPQQYTLSRLVGGWRWLHRSTADGTTRVEDEAWRFRPMPGAPTRLAGRYVRTVEIHGDDRVPFRCNQRPWYRQRAVFDVEVDVARGGFEIREVDHRAEPSPCDPGQRRLGAYTAELAGDRLVLRFPGGAQTLWKLDGELAPLPDDPWPAIPEIAGAWRWDASSFDAAGDVRDESEWWEITRRSETRLDATYRRRVTVRSPDGAAPIACANAPSWTFDDAYVVEATRDGERWRVHELAATPGDHPCLRPTPHRHLDQATAEQIGDHLVLTWRGKRRQVLHRPER